ncbi:50S ribosomal protein L11 methyltransferase [Clostridium sp. 19966]|uniref:50S ribosomal protein L11 methyltransferase n=1 Tax=Clostridium sp. 19966 TaxID=2768166 RepID=UPI0028DEBE17|nr:50S ribosomal protein L11 methyltransferase [Clostridium sp. 19966]MDT8716001.1 50S ribosomal protein L11 methyltransferase [Clostridium sp. 19966]
MIEIIIPVKSEEADNITEKLAAMDYYNVCYSAPIEVTKDNNGYGYYEKVNVNASLSVFIETDNENAEFYADKISRELSINDGITYKIIEQKNWQQPFETIDLKNGWIIANPKESLQSEKIIKFESQGSFGTGIHETTQDCLRTILDMDFHEQNILDLGTGSGILSIAAAIKGAESIKAIDIRDVKEEVTYNANLNNISDIEVMEADVIYNEFKMDEKFDNVFINIGGEETLQAMNFINSVMKNQGHLLVSGLVEWSYDEVFNKIAEYGYKCAKKAQSNEWITTLFKRI